MRIDRALLVQDRPQFGIHLLQRGLVALRHGQVRHDVVVCAAEGREGGEDAHQCFGQRHEGRGRVRRQHS